MTKLSKIYFKFRPSSGPRQVMRVRFHWQSLLAQTSNLFKALGHRQRTVKTGCLVGRYSTVS